MVKLYVRRYFGEIVSEHPTLEDAARHALIGAENGDHYPVKIAFGDKVLWRNAGPDGDAMIELRNIAYGLSNKIKVLDAIAEDMKDDAKNFDGKPFNGRTVAEYFGSHGAAITALANLMKSVLVETSDKTTEVTILTLQQVKKLKMHSREAVDSLPNDHPWIHFLGSLDVLCDTALVLYTFQQGNEVDISKPTKVKVKTEKLARWKPSNKYFL